MWWTSTPYISPYKGIDINNYGSYAILDYYKGFTDNLGVGGGQGKEAGLAVRCIKDN